MTRALLVALVCLAVAPRAHAQDMHMGVMGGGMVSLSTEAETALEPFASISVTAPLWDARRPPELLVDLALSALPGQAVNLSDPQTFNSLEARIGVGFKPFESALFGFYAAGSFATRLPSDPQPRQRTARAVEAGLRMDDGAGNSITVGGGYDERLDGSYQPAVEIAGSVRLPVELGAVKSFLVGRAILGLDFGQYGAARRDVVQVSVAVGR